MRKLAYSIDLNLFKDIKKEIVPVLFTEHQFDLIVKRFTNKQLTLSEKNEFSRTISRKMKAINSIIQKDSIFIYGKTKIREDRLKRAKVYLKQLTRRYKNNHVLISGSFLYKGDYKDIDVFIVSKYDKEDYLDGNFHINYLVGDVYNSLFFASLRRLCISNKKIIDYKMKEKASLDVLISLYQELFNELDRGFKGVRNTIREFLIYAAFVENSFIPDSHEIFLHTNSIINSRNPQRIIKNIFVKSVVLGISPKKAVKNMESILDFYKNVMKEYKQHKDYYLDLMQAFQEVISIES